MDAFILFFLSFFLTSFWFILIFEKDKHHSDSIFWIFYAILLGILSAFLSLFVLAFLQKAFFNIDFFDDWKINLPSSYQELFNMDLYEIIGIINLLLGAFVEEFFKFFTVWFLFSRYKTFKDPSDAMIYLSASGLGFAIIETIANILKYINENPIIQLIPDDKVLSFGILLIFLRFFGANLLHIIASSIIGYGFAMYRITRRILPFFLSFLSASLLHFIFNFVIIIGNNALLALPILWGPLFVVISDIKILDSFYDKRLRRAAN